MDRTSTYVEIFFLSPIQFRILFSESDTRRMNRRRQFLLSSVVFNPVIMIVCYLELNNSCFLPSTVKLRFSSMIYNIWDVAQRLCNYHRHAEIYVHLSVQLTGYFYYCHSSQLQNLY